MVRQHCGVRAGVAAAEHLETGGADPGPQSWGPLKKQEKRESGKQKRHPGAASNRQNQLSAARFLGARPPSWAGYRMPYITGWVPDPPVRSSRAGDPDNLLAPLPALSRAGDLGGSDAWERLGGLTRGPPSCSKWGQRPAAPGELPWPLGRAALIKPTYSPERVGGRQPFPASEGGWET